MLATVAMLHKNECGFQPMTNPDGESLAQRGQKIDERTCTIRARQSAGRDWCDGGEPAGHLEGGLTHFLRDLARPAVPWIGLSACRGPSVVERRM